MDKSICLYGAYTLVVEEMMIINMTVYYTACYYNYCMRGVGSAGVRECFL